MDVTLKHQPAYAAAYVSFEAGETLHVERDAMALMSGRFDIGAGLGGTGVGAALKRKLFGAENIMFGRYTALTDGGFMAVARNSGRCHDSTGRPVHNMVPVAGVADRIRRRSADRRGIHSVCGAFSPKKGSLCCGSQAPDR